jgi:predicted nucleic acid-binding protein
VIYFDAAYIAKCYLNEPGAERVRGVAAQAEGLVSCEWGRLEFSSIIHRHLREGHVTPRETRAVLADFAEDEANGVWHWLPVTSALLQRAFTRVGSLPRDAYLRAGDVVHLTAASEHGHREIYTNDRHMLAGAVHFGLSGIDVIAG